MSKWNFVSAKCIYPYNDMYPSYVCTSNSPADVEYPEFNNNICHFYHHTYVCNVLMAAHIYKVWLPET